MSTSPRSDDSQRVLAEPHTERAPHLDAKFESTVFQCRDAIRGHREIQHLAHYGDGVFDFSVDWLDQHATAHPHRHDLQRLGRALSFTLDRMDRTLQEVRTGAMIRMVLQTRNGVAITNAVVTRKNLVGLVLDQPTPSGTGERPTAQVATADRAISALATELRKLIQLRSTNPGGWEDDTAEPIEAEEEVGAPFVSTPTTPDQRDAAVIEACRRAVRPRDLHLVAYCADNEVVFTADHLDSPVLGPFFTVLNVATRRKFYQEFSRELSALVVELGRTVRGVLGGPLQRLVLDVEQGAVYYYRLRPCTYLVGVTLHQNRVSQADARLAELARQFGNE
jgi:hypothetical protein